MVRQNPKYKIALKYCGTCNPYIDVTRIARHLFNVIKEKDELKLVPISEKDISIIVILCGCFRACGNKEDVRNKSDKYLLIAGESLMGEYIAEKSLPSSLDERLIEILEELRSNRTP